MNKLFIKQKSYIWGKGKLCILEGGEKEHGHTLSILRDTLNSDYVRKSMSFWEATGKVEAGELAELEREQIPTKYFKITQNKYFHLFSEVMTNHLNFN